MKIIKEKLCYWGYSQVFKLASIPFNKKWKFK